MGIDNKTIQSNGRHEMKIPWRFFMPENAVIRVEKPLFSSL